MSIKFNIQTIETATFVDPQTKITEKYVRTKYCSNQQKLIYYIHRLLHIFKTFYNKKRILLNKSKTVLNHISVQRNEVSRWVYKTSNQSLRLPTKIKWESRSLSESPEVTFGAEQMVWERKNRLRIEVSNRRVETLWRVPRRIKKWRVLK